MLRYRQSKSKLALSRWERVHILGERTVDSIGTGVEDDYLYSTVYTSSVRDNNLNR